MYFNENKFENKYSICIFELILKFDKSKLSRFLLLVNSKFDI